MPRLHRKWVKSGQVDLPRDCHLSLPPTQSPKCTVLAELEGQLAVSDWLISEENSHFGRAKMEVLGPQEYSLLALEFTTKFKINVGN